MENQEAFMEVMEYTDIWSPKKGHWKYLENGCPGTPETVTGATEIEGGGANHKKSRW